MQGIKDIFDSERGVFVVFLIVLVTIMVFVDKISSNDWLDYTKWIMITFVAGKTVSHAMETWADKKPLIPVATEVHTTTDIKT